VSSAGTTIEETADGKLVEFETASRGRTIKTLEFLELERPRRIGYRWVEGPLEHVEEEITLEVTQDEATVMRYSGRLGASGLTGWIRTRMVVRPVFDRLVREHLETAKDVAEKRARSSRLYPR